MDRRDFIFAGSAAGMLALLGSSGALAQDGVSITADELKAVIGRDDHFEQMFLSIAALRLSLALSEAAKDPASVNAYASSSKDFSALEAQVRVGQKQILNLIDSDPSPITLSHDIDRALSKLSDALGSAGVVKGSPLFNSMLSNLRVFMAATSKLGRSPDSWFCSMFPFRVFC